MKTQRENTKRHFNNTFSSRDIIDAKNHFGVTVNKQVNELTAEEFNKITNKIEEDNAYSKAYQISKNHGVECCCTYCSM